MNQFLQIGMVALGLPLVLLGYLFGLEKLVLRLPRRRQIGTRAAGWLAPAFLMLVIMLIYPFVETVRLSFWDTTHDVFGGFANYQAMFAEPGFLISIRNNLLWVVFFTGLVTVLGLVVAVLSDKVPYEKLAKAIVVLPTAVSFVGAGVIWGFMYDYKAPGQKQTGTVNALFTSIFPNADPIAWLSDERTNNLALIFIGIWMSTGFATVILSAALKGVPADILEAARLDGAGEAKLFAKVVLPQIMPAVAVVVTLMMINALKVFDIIYVLTNGNYGTQVLATTLYNQLFSSQNPGAASAVAVVLLVATIPILLLNVKIFKNQESER